MDDLNEEVGVDELNATVEEIDTKNETPKELKRRRGPTIMFDVTRIRSLRDKKVVRYNGDGAPIGENGAKLKSFIGSATHYYVPITYTSWKSVPAELKDKIFTTVEAAFVIDPISRKNILQTTVPPEKYSFIEQNHREEFVRSRLSETFQEGSNEVYVVRAKMWKKARVNKQGQYDNDDIQQVLHKITLLNDVLTQALGTKEHNGRVRGVGGYVTLTTYFHSVKKTSKDEANILVENEELHAHGSCSRPIMLEGIEEKGKRIEVESLDKPKENEKKGKR
ncbi:putative serine/threonine-protein kinase nek2 [Cucumis melo var. makuwa]|uniref:Putative serine/threonine-protein kinase nek2 n=1 Tax=Cucumis melo var. makuwa TaxID=1194695 RepID=A0A5D3CNN1_CUCMM|nr:putative serine/threonine-protein kinase nek2 [Cucumis melo var. makuwa]